MIAARAVSKSFHVPSESYRTVKARFTHPFSSRSSEVLHALQDVSFTIPRGEFFGIVGKNGSGKSTLLRCIAGIYQPEAGEIAVQGRLAPFIELGVGFHPEISARDNVLTSAQLLGLSRRQAEERLDDIIAFAELEEFADMKLKNYSTGMAVRLAFAVTVHTDADVLLFDEVLGVGDEAFQQKCFAHFDRLQGEGKTVLLVTHDMDLVTRFCHRALLLHGGELLDIGDPAAVAQQYRDVNAGRAPQRPVAAREQGSAVPSKPPVRAQISRLVGGDPRRFLSLVRILAVTRYKVKYSGTALNYLWALVRPLALFGAMLLFFTQLGAFDQGVAHYPVYLLTAVIMWLFFAQATSVSVTSMVDQAPLLRKLPFPHLVVPLAVVLGVFFDLCINLGVLFVFVVAAGIAPRLEWLELVPLVALLGAFTIGLSLLLSALFVRYRDVDQAWVVASQMLFYATPVFYVSSLLPSGLERAIVLGNPVATVITQARHVLVDPSAPSAAAAAGGSALLLVPLAVVGVVLALGLRVFGAQSEAAAENV
jgi:ABC-type polysaccharide/polyol phosphate transport system ATPase subunit/ABC-type polysaccharide/polyol phosphate export permease